VKGCTFDDIRDVDARHLGGLRSLPAQANQRFDLSRSAPKDRLDRSIAAVSNPAVHSEPVRLAADEGAIADALDQPSDAEMNRSDSLGCLRHS